MKGLNPNIMSTFKIRVIFVQDNLKEDFVLFLRLKLNQRIIFVLMHKKNKIELQQIIPYFAFILFYLFSVMLFGDLHVIILM